MEHQVVLEIWNKLFIVRYLSFSYPYFLQPTEVLKQLFSVLSELTVQELPLPVTQWLAWWLLGIAFIGWDSKRNLLIVKTVHAVGSTVWVDKSNEGMMEGDASSLSHGGELHTCQVLFMLESVQVLNPPPKKKQKKAIY